MFAISTRRTIPLTLIGLSALIAVQGMALLVLVLRLMPGRRRLPPVSPVADEPQKGADGAANATHKYSNQQATNIGLVSVIVATLNEAKRIAPCLQGLEQQGASLLEVLVVDSNSTDGTRALVAGAAHRDARFQLITDGPLPDGWVGKVWALETGLRLAKGEWVLGIDADTIPKPGMIAGILKAINEQQYDAASFGPRFVNQSAAERWLQPAMLVTLVYRTGAAGAEPASPDRVLANGQCFIARRSTLVKHGGYAVSRASFSDDVTLARHLAKHGARIGFLDGSRIIDVHAYASIGQMWKEWGRSFDLKDGASFSRRWLDVLFIWLTMALPLPMLICMAFMQFIARPDLSGTDMLHMRGASASFAELFTALAGINAFLLCIRILLVIAIRDNYGSRGWTFWLSWLADIPAAVRLTLSTARRPRVWRGRLYDPRKQYQA